ncbi:MAG: hypothetical protein WC236_10850 [Gallionellaceae bacterium]|jgi:hypothetical protein
MFVLRFGSSDNEYLELRLTLPSGTEHADAWVQVDASLVVEGFHGSIQPMFEITDFIRFASELQRVYDSLSGQAIFDSRERQLFFTATGNGRGTVTIEGHAYSQATFGNKLEFNLSIDQTFLPKPLAVLNQISQEWAKLLPNPAFKRDAEKRGAP